MIQEDGIFKVLKKGGFNGGRLCNKKTKQTRLCFCYIAYSRLMEPRI